MILTVVNLLDTQSNQANIFLSRLEELEAAIEQRKLDIGNYAPKHPNIGENHAKSLARSSEYASGNADASDDGDEATEIANASDDSTDIMEGLRDELLDYSGEGEINIIPSP